MDKKEKQQAIGVVSSEQVKQWKEKRGDIYTITVADNEGNTHAAYVCKPNRKTVEFAYENAPNQVKINNTLLNNCWLGGSEAIKDDLEMYLACAAKMSAILDIKEAELEKL